MSPTTVSTVTDDGPTLTEVLKRSGLTYRQLDYWCSAGVLGRRCHHGTGKGYRRTWTAEDLHVVCVLARLRAIGTPLDALTEAATLLRSLDLGEGPGWLVIREGRLCDYVTDLAHVGDGLLDAEAVTIVRYDPAQEAPR